MSTARTDDDEMIRWMQQTVHRAYHADHTGLMETCPRDICASTRHFFAERAERSSREAQPERPKRMDCPKCRTLMAYDVWSGTFICQACIPNTLEGAPGWEPKLTPEMNAMLEPLRKANRELDAAEAQPVTRDGRSDVSATSGGFFPTGPAQSPSSAIAPPFPGAPLSLLGRRDDVRPESPEAPLTPLPAFPALPGAPEGLGPLDLLSAALEAAKGLRQLQVVAAKERVRQLSLDIVVHAERSVAEFVAREVPSLPPLAPNEGNDRVWKQRARFERAHRELFVRNRVLDPRAPDSPAPDEVAVENPPTFVITSGPGPYADKVENLNVAVVLKQRTQAGVQVTVEYEQRTCETCGKVMRVPPASNTTECSRCLEGG